MNKPKVKSWLHLSGLVICLAAAVYVSLRQGLSLTERIGAIAVLFAALKTAMGQVLAQVDKAIDDLPEETKIPPSSPNAPVVCLLALGSLLLAASCSPAKVTPAEGVRVAVMCAGTACDTVPPGSCERLIASAISCLVSAGNVPVCLGGIPAAVQVGYADLVCVVDALSIAHDDKAIRESAAKWMRTQNVDVIR